MQVRKSKLFLATLAMISMPLLAHASLETFNYTHEDSSVRVTSGAIKPCSSDAGVFTPKMGTDGQPGHSSVNDTSISGLCLTSKNKTCTANIYNSNNCTGDLVGEASLDLNTKRVTAIKSTNSRYTFEVDGNGSILRVRYTG